MPDGFKTGNCARSAPEIFFFSSTGKRYQFGRGVDFCNSLGRYLISIQDFCFMNRIVPNGKYILLLASLYIHVCAKERERCKFSNPILLKLVKNTVWTSRQPVNKCTWVCVNFWSLVHVPVSYFNSMCFFSSLFSILGVYLNRVIFMGSCTEDLFSVFERLH